MPIEQIPFSGALNLDDPAQNVQNGFLRRWTRNVSWYGPNGNKRPQNLKGTINLFSAYGFSLPAGNNICIGRKYDPVYYRMFWMNYNSNGNHGIYILNTTAGTIQTLIQVGVNTQGDVLGFNPYDTISSIDIIYGDPADGDILIYTDSLYRLTNVNINLYLAGTYNPIKRNYLDVAKQPPPFPVKCVYENANGLVTNNMRNALFQFRVRHRFDSLQKCVYSTISECPLPYDAGDLLIDQDPTKNGRIAAYLPTGDADVQAIEIWMQQTADGITSNWVLVDTLDKTALSIPNNDLYRYLFYNDSIYPSADPALVILDQTYVPRKNQASTLLNGNTIGVANITEGYDPISMPLMSAQVNAITADKMTYNGFLFFAYQNPDTGYVTIYLTGTGTNDGSDNPSTINLMNGATLKVLAQDAAQNSIGFNVVASSITISTVLGQLATAAGGQGWTVVSTGTNTLVIRKTGAVLNSTYYTTSYTIYVAYPNYIDQYVFLPNCNYDFGILYRDSVGRQVGSVLTVPGWALKTPQFNGVDFYLAQMQFIIAHRPPIDATNYQIVRTQQLSYSKLLNWVCRQAYSQITNQIQYCYVDVSNIYDYNQQIQSTSSVSPEGVVSYNFAPGDRIRFMVRYGAGGGSHLLFGNYDYQILSLDINPYINGEAKTGSFVKFYYPTADIDANFAFDGTADFQHYYIYLYNTKQHQTSIVNGTVNQNTYFEFGKAFAIGNEGTDQAYHMGNLTTQKADLSQSAQILINDGDNFFRFRNVPVGIVYNIPTTGDTHDTGGATLDVNLDPTTITQANYKLSATTVTGTISLGPTFYPTFSDVNPNVENISSSDISVRVKAIVPVSANANEPQDEFTLYAKVCLVGGTVANLPVLIPKKSNMTPMTQFLYEFDVVVNMPAGSKMWFISWFKGNVSIGGFNLYLSVLDNINIAIVEPSFSDVYAINTTSNGRPAIVDPNSKEQVFPAKFRFSQPDQQGTNLNGMNIFYPNDMDEFDRSKGGVMMMVARDRNMRVFQERGTGVVGVYAKFIKNNAGETQLIVTDTIITPNNIQYYDGEFGLGNQPDGLFSDGLVDYFTDPVKGYIIRVSQAGMDAISIEAKIQSFIGPLATQYLNNIPGYYGGYAKFLGCVFYKQDKDKEALFVFQSGTGLQGDTVVWDEKQNAFTGFRDWQPDQLECGENVLYMWQNGVLYSQNNANQYNTFFSQYGVIEQYGKITQYGIIYPSFIDAIFNPQPNAKKEFLAISYNSPYGNIWISPDSPNINTELGNESTLLAEDYDYCEGMYSAAFWRDVNSPGGLIEGDFMKGIWMEFIAQNTSSDLTYIFGLYLNYIFSPRNG